MQKKDNSYDTNILILEFDSNIYSIKAIKNAAYDYLDKATFQIKANTPDKITVSINPRPKDYNLSDSLMADFKNHVLDHQVRIEVGEDFKNIREMIVAQAFEPCDNLQELVEALKP